MRIISILAVALFLMGATATPKVDLDGELEIIVIDRHDRVEYEYNVKDSKGQRHRIKMPASYKHGSANLRTGQRIKVRGSKVVAPKSPISPSREVLAIDSLEVMSVLPNTLGVRKVIVFSVSYSNQGAPTDNASARTFMQSVINPFYQESSYGRMSFAGNKNPNDVADFFEAGVSAASGGCDLVSITNGARAAAAKAGFPVNMYGAYNHFVYFIPTSPCGWSGLATLGGTGGFAICNGQISHRVCSHEIGHNLGLYHSGCANGYGGGSEYCDFMDVMGNSGNSMGAWNRERLGWLNNVGMPPLTTVTTPGDYSIRALNTLDNAAKGLKIAKTDGFTYYVTYRNGVGIGGAEGKPAGVYVHQGPSTDGAFGPSQLFLMLPIGEVWREQNIPIWLTAKSCTAMDCILNVSFGGQPPSPKPVIPTGLTLQLPSTINYGGKDIPLGWK